MELQSLYEQLHQRLVIKDPTNCSRAPVDRGKVMEIEPNPWSYGLILKAQPSERDQVGLQLRPEIEALQQTLGRMRNRIGTAAGCDLVLRQRVRKRNVAAQ